MSAFSTGMGNNTKKNKPKKYVAVLAAGIQGAVDTSASDISYLLAPSLPPGSFWVSVARTLNAFRSVPTAASRPHPGPYGRPQPACGCLGSGHNDGHCRAAGTEQPGPGLQEYPFLGPARPMQVLSARIILSSDQHARCMSYAQGICCLEGEAGLG